MKNKYYLVVSLLLLLTGGLFAQGNLQFNQVINITLNGVPPFIASQPARELASTTIVIPAGKVWKLESFNLSVTQGSQPATAIMSQYLSPVTASISFIFLDEVVVYISQTDVGDIKPPPQIIWLPAGSHTFSLWSESAGSAVTWSWKALITGIEFNVVP